MVIIEFIVGVLLARLVWKAFQGWCANTGRSESAGAISLLKFLFFAAILLGGGLLVLANILSR